MVFDLGPYLIILILIGFIIVSRLQTNRPEKSRECETENETTQITQLDQAESRFKLMFDSSPNTIIVVGEQGNITMINSKGEELFGYPNGQLIGKPIEALIPKEIHQHHIKLRNQFIQKPLDHTVATRGPIVGINQKGEKIPLEIGLNPFTSEGSHYVLATITDISQRQNMEAEIRYNIQRFKDLTELSSDWSWEMDRRGEFSFVSDNVEALLGYPAEQMLGCNLTQFMPELEAERIYPLLRQFSLNREAFKRIEYKMNCRDGRTLTMLASGVPLYDKDNHFSGYRGINQDITAQKSAQRDLQKYQHNLEEMVRLRTDSLQRAEKLAHVGSWHLDLRTDDLTWSSETFRIFGIDERQGITQAHFLELIHPEDRQRVSRAWDQAKQGSRFDVQHRITVSGKTRWVREMADIVTGKDGEALYAHGAAQDITRQKEAVQQTIQAAQNAQASAKAKSDFLANMSHEIRSPMNAVLGTTFLLGETELDSNQRSYVKTLASTSRSLLHIIDDILDFSKIESGHLQLESHPFSLQDLLKNVQSTMAGIDKSPDVDFIIDPRPKGVNLLRGDSLRIQQILTNFIANAFKFTENGQARLKIIEQSRTRLEEHEYVTLRFEVSDTGIGIEEKNQKLIFNAFSQEDVSTTRQFGGTGLGLSICEKLVHLMDGRIGVNSQPGKGSTFWFELSLLLMNDEQLDITEISIISESETLDQLCALIVDDGDINREMTRDILAKYGIKAKLAKNGAEAVEIIEKKDCSIDFIIMDVQMPVMDGLTATRILRYSTGYHKPIIGLSAGVLAAQSRDALEAGMDIFLAKPIKVPELISAIERLTRKQIDREEPDSQSTSVRIKPSVTGLDIEHGLANCGDELRYRKYLEKFLQQYRALPDEVTSHINQGHFDEAEQRVHKLKGVAGTLGMQDLGHLATRLNLELKQPQDNDQLNLLLLSLTNSMDLCLQAIELYLDKSSTAPPP